MQEGEGAGVERKDAYDLVNPAPSLGISRTTMSTVASIDAYCGFAVLMAQLSPDAMLAFQSGFRPVVHPDTFHQLNQYAAFMSESTGALLSPGGLAERLDFAIDSWLYSGMPAQAQVSLQEPFGHQRGL